MPLYRAAPTDGVAWVTGASKGIGRALALKLVERGYRVAVTARDPEELDELVAASSAGKILPYPCDVADERAMRRTVAQIEREAGPVALAVMNAGIYLPTRGDRLEASNFEQTFAVNLFGQIYGLVPVSEYMRQRGRGQIVLMGSASAAFGWPSAAAYGASKAAVNNLAEALKYDFDKMNIRIQVINPGFVDTPLTQRVPEQKPDMISAEAAALKTVAAIERGGFETSYPARFSLLMKLLHALPQPLRFAVMNRLTGWSTRKLAAPRKPRSGE